MFPETKSDIKWSDIKWSDIKCFVIFLDFQSNVIQQQQKKYA